MGRREAAFFVQRAAWNCLFG